MSNRLVIQVSVSLLVLGACAGPQTRLGSVSQDEIVIEQARQQQFALQAALKQTLRLQSVAEPLLRAAVPLCEEKVRPMAGYLAGNAYLWKNDYFNAALSIGYNDTLTVLNVSPGLAADAAGLKSGDRILAINSSQIVTGPRAVKDLEAKLPTSKQKTPQAYSLTYRRGSETRTISILPEMACSYTPQFVNADEVNAYADGRSIFVTSGIMRFVSDDNELALVVAHELAHDAMHHIDAKTKNSMIGLLIGAVVDVAAATQGVSTDFARQGAELGSMVFSQDFEREADYVGLYILALANRPIEDTPNLWRRMATARPGNIKFASSHPTTAERFVRLDKWRNEIDKKVAMGLPLRPEMKKGNSMFASSAVAATSKPSLSRRASDPARALTAMPSDLPRSAAPDRAEHGNLATSNVKSIHTEEVRTPVSVPRSSRTSESAALEPMPSGVAARAVIGAPSSDSARVAAIGAFEEANSYMGSHQWTKAESSFRKTVLLDGSVAKYHAGLASVLMVLERWKDAEAEYTAAVLLDLDSPIYRRMVKEARSKR